MKKHRTPEQWQTLINQHRNSGLSIKQFCQQHKLACSCFYTWRKRLAEQATPTQEPYQSMATKPSAVVLSKGIVGLAGVNLLGIFCVCVAYRQRLPKSHHLSYQHLQLL